MPRILLVLMLLLVPAFAARADVRDLLRAGLQARDGGDFDKAVDLFSQAIASGQLPAAVLVRVLITRGVTYDMKNDLPNAIADFDAAIVLAPDVGETFIHRGLAQARSSEPLRAIADFSEAARLDAGQAFLALSNRGNVYKGMGDNPRALADYNEAIRLNPGYPASFYNRGLFFYEQDDFTRAIADFTVALKIDPTFTEALINRSATHAAADDLERALADLDVAIELNPRDHVAFGNRGVLRLSQADFASALVDFDEAISLQPNNSRGHTNRGIAKFYDGQHTAAVGDLERAVELSTTNTTAIIWLHLVRARAGQDDLSDLSRLSVHMDRTRWPGQLVDLHLGRIDIAALRSIQPPVEGLTGQNVRACEQNFQIGVFLIEQARQDEAQGAIEAAVATCRLGSIEHGAARAESQFPPKIVSKLPHQSLHRVNRRLRIRLDLQRTTPLLK